MNSSDALLIDMVYSMANLLNIKVVAEGVESEVHANFLSKYPLLIQQGYFYGKPMPVNQWLDIKFKKD